MEIVVGTYDEMLLGFRLVQVGKIYQIETSFSNRSHAGCVKALAVSHKGVLASGSTDESIMLLNLRKQRELGSLLHHAGTITSLAFHKDFLFSTSEDKTMCLWKSFTWECMRTFKGHKSAVNCVSVHPSGKLALTVGRDKALHSWNLISGRSAYVTNLKQVADIVKWSPDGERFLIVVNNKIDVYITQTAEVSMSIEAEGRINSVDFLDNDVCVYGGEGGKVVIHNIQDNTILHTLDTGTDRIKGLCLAPPVLEGEKHQCLVTASSGGFIKLYSLNVGKDAVSTELMMEHDTGFRLTCLAVYSRNAGTQETETDMVPTEEPCELDNSDEQADSIKAKQTKKFKKNKKAKMGKTKNNIEVKTGDLKEIRLKKVEEESSDMTKVVKRKKERKSTNIEEQPLAMTKLKKVKGEANSETATQIVLSKKQLKKLKRTKAKQLGQLNKDKKSQKKKHKTAK